GLDDVRRRLAEYIAQWGKVFEISSAQFREWVAVRLAFILPGFADLDDHCQALLRRFTGRLCTALRWVAAQEPPDAADPSVVRKCLESISVLAWRHPTAASSPFIQGADRAWAPWAQIDPLRAAACLRTANWLSANDRLPSRCSYLSDDIDV